MKKYLIYTAAAIVAVSCAKNPAPVETPNEEPGAPAVEGNVAIQFSSNLVANPQTKAAGFVDEWNKQELFIYGFPRTGSPLATDYANPFIDNVSATAPEKGESDPVTKGKIDVWKVKPTTSDPATPGEYYYYEGTKTYDFFGYYADGAIQDNPTKGANGVTASVTITGGEDIMVAAASVTDAVDAAKTGNDKWDAENLNWNPQYAFSAYAARRGVHPILKFKHLLTQLKFTVTSGGDLEANKLYIKSITLANVSNSATLTVAGETLGFSQLGEANQQLSVVYAYGETNTTLASQNDNKGADVPASTETETTPKSVGAPIMPFEANSFKILIQLSQVGVAEDPAPIEQIIDMTKVLVPDNTGKKPTESGYSKTYGTTEDKFEAGKAYTINFKLYGLEKVEVTAELTAWKEGGQIEIDTDTPPEVNPTTPSPEPGN